MRIKKHHNFFALKKDWEELYEANPELSIYQSYEYSRITFMHYLPYLLVLKAVPSFFVITENDKPIMIFPLCKKIFKKEHFLFGYKSGSGYLDCIYKQDIGKDKLKECFDLLSQLLKGSKLYIERIKDDSFLCHYLIDNYGYKEQTDRVSIDLPDTYDEYYGALSKNTRETIRNAYNRLKNEQKTMVVKTFFRQPLPTNEQSEIMKMYKTRMKTKYEHKGGILYDLFIDIFDIGTIATQKRSDVVHFILYVDGCAVAFYQGFISLDSSTIMATRLAIDINYAKFSPGVLLINESVKKIMECNIAQKLDLTHGTEKYKYSMGGKTQHCYIFEIAL